MTSHELAESFDHLAEALRKFEPFVPEHGEGREIAYLQGPYAVGAALFWSYLRDLVTGMGKDLMSKPELLVFLETVARDHEIFPPGLCELVADLDKEDDAAPRTMPEL